MKSISLEKKIGFLLIFIFLSVFSTVNNVFAVTAYPYVSTLIQPDGTKFGAYIKGDEYFNYYVDESDNLILKDKEDDTWKYIINKNGKLDLGEVIGNKSKRNKSSKKNIIKSSVLNSETKKKEYLKLQGKSTNIEKRQNSKPVDLTKVPLSKKSKSFKGLSDSGSSVRELPMVIIDVSFQDIETENTEKWYDTVYNDPDGIRAYYKEVSNNKFTVAPVKETNTSHPGTIKVKLDRVHGNWGNDFNKNDFNGAMQEILTKASSYINFNDYDINKNGIIDNNELVVVFIFAGYEAAMLDAAEPNFWASQIEYITPYLKANNTYIMNFVGFAEKRKLDNEPDENINSTATLCHELGHYLGLSDLYDIDYGAGKWAGCANLEYTSLMDNGNWGYEKYEGAINTKFIPSHLDAFSKSMLGYYEKSYILKNGEYTLNTASNNINYNLYIIPTNDKNKFYIIENRQFKNFDRALGTSYKSRYGLVSCEPGIVVYMVDIDKFKKYNSNYTVNSSYHPPGISLIRPSSDNYEFPSPFWSDFIYNLNDLKGYDKVPFMFMWSNDSYSIYRTDIVIDTNTPSKDKMTINVALPKEKVSSIKTKNSVIDSNGGKVSFRVEGKNFYGDMTLSVFDNKGNKINEDWAHAVIKNEDVLNIVKRNGNIEFPKNDTKENEAYVVRASFDGGKTYSNKVSDITVKTSYTKEDVSTNEGVSNINDNKNGETNQVSSAKTSDSGDMDLWLIILGVSVLGTFGVSLKIKYHS
ncbi:M6 family metalloprotease domain-containing protein [Anaerofustis stercorihominis]|uniref:M6 family metalloprotease domain-containing protein n=1 Tax=Anaerofustis stercorihominis TaxID=214853 RepID=UPI00214C7919|nr:M6 family metalloprotease domain-containing protein [Anaerofustis stercorihominis]MCR2031990.1 M6 family metalloprotease domain-containing protein [Anaerofustis stercorihominis]